MPVSEERSRQRSHGRPGATALIGAGGLLARHTPPPKVGVAGGKSLVEPDKVELAKALPLDALDTLNHRFCLAQRILGVLPCG